MMWELIAANRRKSFFLFAGMATLLVALALPSALRRSTADQGEPGAR